ncbi:transposase [Candidatus Bathyarchaeota archaeon]|nr:transposase [Candidatus Bathyarchaeota archaeon]MBS7618521.1 transposase [Candidatus Bathyarchaeota archaeon]
MSRRLETVKLTAGFKVAERLDLEPLFSTYKEILNELLDYTCKTGITSFKRLKSEKYNDMRSRYSSLPSHYIYTACQMACSIYKSFRKLRRRGLAKADKPIFKGNVVMLDDHLFSVDLESWRSSIATDSGRIGVSLCHGTYHEKFKVMRVGQAWLVKRGCNYYLKVVFSRVVEVAEPNGKAIAVDINEDNVTFGSKEKMVKRETGERAIRTAYFLKRRRLQSKLRLNEKPLMAKYRGRERRRVEAVYHELAKEVIEEAKRQGCSTIILENLKNIRRRKRSKELNGRLNRWGFRRLQAIIEYKAELAGLTVKPVSAKGTSSLCPKCRVKLSPSGHRMMRCPRCGLEEDRDKIAVINLLQKADRCALFNRSGRKPPHDTKGEEPAVTEVNAGSER